MPPGAERIASLAASGLSPSAISSIVGLSPARISQIQKTEEYQELEKAKRIEIEGKDQEELSLSAKYLEAEHILVKQVIDMAPVSELRDVVGALRVVAERQERAKSRMNPVYSQQPVFNTVVQLQLPQHAIPELKFAQNKEVVSIENRNLSPLSSQGVLSLFKGMDSSEEQREELPNLSQREDSSEEAGDSHKRNILSTAEMTLQKFFPSRLSPISSTGV